MGKDNPIEYTEIIDFLKKVTGVSPNTLDTDIYNELGVVGDDFHELIDKYAERFKIDMENYLWYFHCDEEGINIASLFFKAPYQRVKRIPITPRKLLEFTKTKKWNINYPPHKIPKVRYDMIIGNIIVIIFVLTFLILVL
ncbi:MAG: DUF1493 family protein [Opitutaceae bacterium]|nr:DUF1493 family protein [Cytophagales bacterium]